MDDLIYLLKAYFTKLKLLQILYCSVREILVYNVLKKVESKDPGLTWTTFLAIYQSDIVKPCNIFLRIIFIFLKVC
jgi:hypothetical protein